MNTSTRMIALELLLLQQNRHRTQVLFWYLLLGLASSQLFMTASNYYATSRVDFGGSCALLGLETLALLGSTWICHQRKRLVDEAQRRLNATPEATHTTTNLRIW